MTEEEKKLKKQTDAVLKVKKILEENELELVIQQEVRVIAKK